MNKEIQKILLVDDNNATNFYNKRALKKYGYTKEIVVAIDGKKALDHINTFNNIPQLIFLDINMPIMNGIEFLEEVSKIDKFITSNSLVIIMTSTEMSTDMLEKVSVIPNLEIIKEKMLSQDSITLIDNTLYKKRFDKNKINLAGKKQSINNQSA